MKALSERVQPLKHSVVTDFKKSASEGISRFWKLIFIFSLLLMSFRVAAPEANSFIIYEYQGIGAFTDLMYATAMVETMGNPLAYNEFENAVGIFQIRQVRIDEYNRRTGLFQKCMILDYQKKYFSILPRDSDHITLKR